MIQLPKFKIRASQAGKIMGPMKNKLTPKQEEELTLLIDKGSKSKKREELEAKRDLPEELPTGAKSYCLQWVKDHVYNRSKENSSKYTDKGILVEDEAIEFIGQYHFLDLKKNTERRENDYFSGECDILVGDNEIFDNKSSYDYSTFPFLDSDLKNKDYYYQGQIYLDLWDRDAYRVCYTLVNTPAHLIEEEARKKAYNSEESLEKIREEMYKYHTYDDLDDELRYTEYSFIRNELVIQSIRDRVDLCQKCIDEEIIPKLKETLR